MNPDTPQTPREELEARLTALLLGELDADEAAAVRRAIAQDAALAQLHERLKRTIDLVREVAASPAEPATAQTAPLRLSDERREKLLAHFQTLRPKPIPSLLRRVKPWLVPIVATAVIALLLSAVMMPKFANVSELGMTAAYPLKQQESEMEKLTPTTAAPQEGKALGLLNGSLVGGK